MNGVVCATYKEACFRRGLLQDDREWEVTLAEAVVFQTGRQLRSLFATMLVFCDPVQPHQRWERYRVAFVEDIAHRVHAEDPTVPEQEIEFFALREVDDFLGQHGKSLADFPQLPVPPPAQRHVRPETALIQEQRSLVTPDLPAFLQQNLPKLNMDQRAVFDAVSAAVLSDQHAVFFVDEPGGTGKTFTHKVLLAHIRTEGRIALAMASSGIAAIV